MSDALLPVPPEFFSEVFNGFNYPWQPRPPGSEHPEWRWVAPADPAAYDAWFLARRPHRPKLVNEARRARLAAGDLPLVPAPAPRLAQPSRPGEPSIEQIQQWGRERVASFPEVQQFFYRHPTHDDYYRIQQTLRPTEAVVVIHLEDLAMGDAAVMDEMTQRHLLPKPPSLLRWALKQDAQIVAAGFWNPKKPASIKQVALGSNGSSVVFRNLDWDRSQPRADNDVHILHAAFTPSAGLVLWYNDFQVVKAFPREDPDLPPQHVVLQHGNPLMPQEFNDRGPRIFRHTGGTLRVGRLPRWIYGAIRLQRLVVLHDFPRSKRKEPNPTYRRIVVTGRVGKDDVSLINTQFEVKEMRDFTYIPEILPKMMI